MNSGISRCCSPAHFQQMGEGTVHFSLIGEVSAQRGEALGDYCDTAEGKLVAQP